MTLGDFLDERIKQNEGTIDNWKMTITYIGKEVLVRDLICNKIKQNL